MYKRQDEEVVRLKSHIQHMKETLEESNGIGRTLDFIAQEMNREANTILSLSLIHILRVERQCKRLPPLR